MSDTVFRPVVNGYESTLIQDLDASGTSLTLYLASVPTATIPAGKYVAVVVSARTTNQEIMKVESIDTALNTMTVATGGRGLNLGNGQAGTINEHTVGATVIISADYITLDDYGDAIDSKVDTAGDTMTGPLTFSGTTNSGLKVNNLTTAQRTALTGANGMVVYDSDLGLMFQYVAGAWGSIDTGTTTPNASSTVAGKVEIATQSENSAGTATGGTGASIVATPDLNAVSVQNSVWSYAADAQANDTYVITLVPAISAYATGQIFSFKANTANTGAATLNVNGKGAITIKKAHDQDLETNDIESGQIVTVVYDGTNFEMQSQKATEMTTAASATLTAGAASNADALHTHSFMKNVQNIYTPVSFGATAAETTILTLTLPGGTLGTTGSIRIKCYVSALGFTGSGTFTIRLKYGGTTYAGFTSVNAIASPISGLSGYIEYILMANGTTGNQVAFGLSNLAIPYTGATTVSGTYSHASAAQAAQAVDSTTNQTLAITGQYDSNAAGNTFAMTLATVEVIV